MLDKDYRNKLRLAHPPISLDLSGVIIVLFASGRSAACRVLSDRCDTLWVERVGQQEKEGVVQAIFEDGCRAYGDAELTLDQGCTEFLAGYETSDVSRIVDYAIQGALYDGLSLITKEMLVSVCRDREINMTRKGFGFVGGNENA